MDYGALDGGLPQRNLGVYGRAKEVDKLLMSLFAFLKEVYGRTEEADNFFMSQQLALKHTWETMVALSFRILGLALEYSVRAATDAEYHQNITTTLSTSPSWRSSPVPTTAPAMRHTLRRAALPAPRGSA